MKKLLIRQKTVKKIIKKKKRINWNWNNIKHTFPYFFTHPLLGFHLSRGLFVRYVCTSGKCYRSKWIAVNRVKTSWRRYYYTTMKKRPNQCTIQHISTIKILYIPTTCELVHDFNPSTEEMFSIAVNYPKSFVWQFH